MPSAPGKAEKSARARRPRGSINPADIIAGAFDFFRDTPVEQWSIPQLAAHLDVGVTSIYWYFRTKRELVAAMTEAALSSFYERMPPLRGDDWEGLLRNFFLDYHRLLAADDLACDLIVRQIGASGDETTARSWPRAQELFTALADAGLPDPIVQHAFFTLSVYTQGFLLVERKGRHAPPLNAAGSDDPSSELEFGITNILRGLRPLLETPAPAQAQSA
ncbi:TetR/AcrR family transcriptional regulator [Cryptosporangium aurantiacum]|uniref:Transcriptional regulator, TetR family n=1 Tax=Cryptosporangium aurantiacum TaxID=134849 RepID=A0A1M7KQK2_9ACTN|nr:TetR/AcrR family transcriptional regulator [Cryptosporangium aurantiacum]SHM67719.1 transcriptional regulator, TetR family [Cryptosporangium aurantiacum]